MLGSIGGASYSFCCGVLLGVTAAATALLGIYFKEIVWICSNAHKNIPPCFVCYWEESGKKQVPKQKGNVYKRLC